MCYIPGYGKIDEFEKGGSIIERQPELREKLIADGYELTSWEEDYKHGEKLPSPITRYRVVLYDTIKNSNKSLYHFKHAKAYECYVCKRCVKQGRPGTEFHVFGGCWYVTGIKCIHCGWEEIVHSG